MDAVTVGHASIDRVKIAGREKLQAGGAAVYSALAAKTFCRCGIVTRVGSDYPQEFLRELEKWGVDTRGIKRVSGRSTRFEIEYNSNGQAHYTGYHPGAGRSLKKEDIPPRYLTAKAYHIAPMSPRKQRSFVEYLREHTYGIISLNTHVSYFKNHRREVRELIGEVDIFTINDHEAMRLTLSQSLEHAISVLKKHEHRIIVVTLGMYGSIVLEDGEVSFSPSVVQSRVVDLTGCGDAFAGAFLASYLKTEDAVRAANIANSIAAINASDWSFRAISGLKFRSIEAFP
ncbi:MAG: carbohydrate kinase family protein [Euryarchaeota archaeon]|nr:carbohydrate kinase family protein [Euryarchaeota archaeon]